MTTHNDPAFWGGLDLGEQAGWAVLDLAGERLASGLWDCSIRRGEGAGFRVIRMRRCLRELVDGFPGIAFGYERVEKHEVRLPNGKLKHNTYAAQVYGELRGAAAGLLDEIGVPFAGVPVGVVKKRATNKGNAGKPAMVAAANARWGTSITEDGNDEADALWIAACALEGLTA